MEVYIFWRCFSLMGAKNPKCVEKKCVHEGAEYCEFELTWDV
ncbi:MAG: hypothetical protein ACP5JR_03335 [Thermoplasmata archaeon]